MCDKAVAQDRRGRLLTLSFLPLFPELVPRNPYPSPDHLCPAGHRVLGFPGLGTPKPVLPQLPAPGELSCQGGAGDREECGGREHCGSEAALGVFGFLPGLGSAFRCLGTVPPSASWVLSSATLVFPRPPPFCPRSLPLPLSLFPSLLSFLFLISSSGKLTLPHPPPRPPRMSFPIRIGFSS